ncbi:MAG: hypothetical protein DME24_24240 [Verrucomicrobia bacterium]|nr:MAG: hypothetical protein DME24_24240 [Verrucomicrobiota bacterium]
MRSPVSRLPFQPARPRLVRASGKSAFSLIELLCTVAIILIVYSQRRELGSAAEPVGSPLHVRHGNFYLSGQQGQKTAGGQTVRSEKNQLRLLHGSDHQRRRGPVADVGCAGEYASKRNRP